MVQADLGKKARPYLKLTRAKRAGGVAQAAEHLPSKFEALNSNPNTTNKNILKKKKMWGSSRTCGLAL
jgi:hypothetical protein